MDMPSVGEIISGCVSCVAQCFSSQAFAKVEVKSASRSNEELPVIICCSFIRAVPLFFLTLRFQTVGILCRDIAGEYARHRT